ncbi:hypothetical protein ACNPPY_00300 [Achromobacter sp. AGC78]
MTENNAAQPGLTELRQALNTLADHEKSLSYVKSKGYDTDKAERCVQAAQERVDALLSKLRAEGVQAGDERVAESYFEDELESAYWEMDARIKGLGQHKGRPQPDRDALKWAVRGMRRMPPKTAPERICICCDVPRNNCDCEPESAALASAPVAGEAVTDDMRDAVRFAPSSAYWSRRLVEFFGPHAREGINALEKQLRAALADASAAGEATVYLDAGHMREVLAGNNMPVSASAEPGRGMVPMHAAPQASEAVRNEALYLLREARALLPMFATAEAIGDWSEKVNRFAAGDVIDIPPQADKDGGDCAKGAGDAMAIHPEIQAVLAMLDVPVLGYLGSHSGKLIKSSDKVDSFESAVPLVSETAHRAACEKIIAALSPTPSVVKQSLTATQTGEKGESDA